MSMLTVEECELLTDSKYRSYITQVEKALRSFEYTSEWADLISALGKLNKVLISHLKYPVIPKKVTIGKRLAQCLHPALPSGVHLKALETYDIIFKCIGTQRLAHDLFIYSAGMFPLLGHAAMSVKPVLLTIYERHFVALGRHIKPGLNGLLLGLLPGLEEGSEYFDRTNLLLEDFCDAVGPPFFYTGIWECMLSCPSVRLCGAIFLLNHLNKKQSMEDQLHMVGLDIDLMVSSLCSGLQDSSVLVQRSMLDFLLVAFPMHTGQLTKADLGRVVEAALNVVLRRDMSLNRRLYAWLLGTNTSTPVGPVPCSGGAGKGSDLQRADSSSTTGEMDLSYFQTYSRDLLVLALKSKLKEEENPCMPPSDGVPVVIKPFRILISLLDKPEIGPVILESVLLSVFRRLKYEGELYTQSSQQGEQGKSGLGPVPPENKLAIETLKTANLLFGSFEPYFIWDFIGRNFAHVCEQRNKFGAGNVVNDDVSLLELCDLVEFVLDIIALDVYPETATEHLPDLLHQVISALTPVCDKLDEVEITAALKLCSCLLARVQPSMAGQRSFSLDRSFSVDTLGDNVSVFSNSELVASAEQQQKREALNGLKLDKKEEFDDSKDRSCEAVSKEQKKGIESRVKLSSFEADVFQNNSNHINCIKGVNEEEALPPGSQIFSEEDTNKSREDQFLEKPPTTNTYTTTTTSSNQKAAFGHLSLMQLCVQSFQQFFHSFAQLHILQCPDFAQACMNGLIGCGKPCHKTPPLFLQPPLNGKNCQPTDEESSPRYSSKDEGYKKVDECSSAEVLQAYKQACKLLVDFASFPVYCLDYETIIEQMCSKEESSSLPPWLQDLLVCSCYIDCFEIQGASISTVLDLIILTQSVQTESENKTKLRHHHGQRSSVSEGRISVVILPALLPSHLVFINQRTKFYQVVAQELWVHLSENYTVHHQQTVELFHTLHQVTPSAAVCEDVIGHDLICESESDRISAFQKFSVLWHLTRSIKTEPNPSREPRTFDRSMFVVLDSLKEESSITKTLAMTWLTHVIQRGDTSRVLQPLLLMLLHPDTARISIQHVSVHKPKKVSISEDGEEDVEAKIYAISSEGGNVIYHLSQPGRQTNLTRIKSGSGLSLGHSKKSPEELQSYALSVMNTKTGTASTAPVRTHSVTDLSFERVNPQDISLRINPFGSASSLDKLIFDGYDFPQSASMPNLEGVKRLDSSTCKKEGIFFDGSDVVEDHFKAESPVHSEDIKKDTNQSKTEIPPKPNDIRKLDIAGEKIISDSTDTWTVRDSETNKTDAGTSKMDVEQYLEEEGGNDLKANESAVNCETSNSVIPSVITVVTQPSPTEEESNMSDAAICERNETETVGMSMIISEAESSNNDPIEKVVRCIIEEIVASAITNSLPREDSFISDGGSVSKRDSSSFGHTEDNHSSDDWRKAAQSCGESTDSDSDNTEFQSLVASSASESHLPQIKSSPNILNAGSMDSLLNNRAGDGCEDGEGDDESQKDGKENDNQNRLLDSSSSTYFIDHRNLDPSTDIHELHLHMLLYAQQYDFRRTLYALSTIRAMLHNCPRLVVTAMATTNISSVRAPHLAKLQSLLGRHRKSVFGKNFFGELPPEVMSSYRSNMFVEIVISLCLYFVRGYYPNLMMHKLTKEELLGNKMVHILGVEILTLLMSELLSIMKESGKSFVSYISDLLSRCKLQKSLLHCLLASVYNMGRSQTNMTVGSNEDNKNGFANSKRSNTITNKNNHKSTLAKEGAPTKAETTLKLTEMIIDFNENRLDPSVNDTFQMRLLQLMLVTIMLEERIRHAQGETDTASSSTDRPHLTSSLLNAHYNPSQPVVLQEMFLSAVWSALKQHHQAHLHRHWIGLVTSALPYMGRAMPRTVLCVVLQLCRNLDIMALDLTKSKSSMQRVPPDHMVSMLEGLTTLCHYCLLDNSSPVSIGQPAPSSTHVSTETASAGQILTNLIHVFNPSTSGKEQSPARDSAPVQPVLEARTRVLSVLPRVMACMATLWKAVTVTTQDGVSYITCHPHVGDFKLVRHHILELLSPISLPHGTHLLAAFAVAWNDRRQKSLNKGKTSVMSTCEDQLLLVELVSAIKVLPTDTLIQTVKQVVKQPPQTELTKKGLPLEVNLLQFFLAYIHHTTTSAQLLDSWASLLSLLRDCLQMNLSPPALFLLLQILHEFVQKTPTMEEKKHQKDLQDICQKALESVSAIAGSSLEQTTWLRRNFAVKPGPQIEGGEEAETQEDRGSAPEVNSAKAPTIRRNQASDSKYSVQALSVLAELTAPMLDVIYSSEEKDKVASFLSTLLYNVFPYLRHHSSHNLPSYRACSQMLSSISGYQYTRRSWRKEAFEMLMEASFFQMDSCSISYWHVIIDNLMTHDKTTFKDLMSRVSINQTGSLNLFSSKEQEYEQRSQVMKRLAFTIFCSEPDQYQRAMPEIQERLAECLRLPQVANVMTSVFLCFRVLILRMSPQHLTSLWPTIITEMVQVLLQIEQELSTETDEFNEYLRTRSRTQIQRIAALDSSWAHLGNGLNAHNNPAWLQLYLAVCKLLDMCLVMPADQVPQFQLYRWAFVGTAGEEDYETFYEEDDHTSHRPNPLFTPHIIRLSRLINLKLKKRPSLLSTEPGRPLLTMHRMRSLAELQTFFHTLVVSHASDTHTATSPATSSFRQSYFIRNANKSAGSNKGKHNEPERKKRGLTDPSSMTNRQYIEHLLETDFLEHLI